MSETRPENQAPQKTIPEVAREVGRYDTEAYYFVFEALDDLLEHIGRRRHVTGAELSHAIRELALRRFGMLAGPVLKSWGLSQSSDFGQIVFALVQAGLMSKTEQDSIRDFDAVYDFDQAFGNYRISGETDEDEEEEEPEDEDGD